MNRLAVVQKGVIGGGVLFGDASCSQSGMVWTSLASVSSVSNRLGPSGKSFGVDSLTFQVGQQMRFSGSS